MDLISIIFLVIAGLGGGVVTGLVGASATVVITPILVAFLSYPAFLAIGIGLATDVFASAISARYYYNYKNIDIKNGIILTVVAVIGALAGSFLSNIIPDSALGRGAGAMILIIGFQFLYKPINKRLEDFQNNYKLTFFKNHKIFSSIAFGLLIGLICGVVGAGGGVMILMILTFILGYEIKTAVGTSVLIMTFIALSGAIGHFVNISIPYLEIAIAGVASMVGAGIASKFANTTSEEKLSKVIGFTFILLGVITIIKRFL